MFCASCLMAKNKGKAPPIPDKLQIMILLYSGLMAKNK